MEKYFQAVRDRVNSLSRKRGKGTDLCFGRKSLNLLDEESVWFHHDYQRHASCLLDTTDQARVVHHFRPLAKGRRSLTATIGAADNKSGHGATPHFSVPFLKKMVL